MMWRRVRRVSLALRVWPLALAFYARSCPRWPGCPRNLCSLVLELFLFDLHRPPLLLVPFVDESASPAPTRIPPHRTRFTELSVMGRLRRKRSVEAILLPSSAT